MSKDDIVFVYKITIYKNMAPNKVSPEFYRFFYRVTFIETVLIGKTPKLSVTKEDHRHRHGGWGSEEVHCLRGLGWESTSSWVQLR